MKKSNNNRWYRAISSAVFGAIALASAAAMIYFHAAASLTLPVPWGDEALFVWQARAFERWNTFIAPEIDASRPILHQPFVYAATLGLVFKVFGHSLEVARSLSLIFLLTGFVFLAALIRCRAAPLASILLAGAFLLNGHFVAMGNVARMEALLFAVVCGAMLLIQIAHVWTALAILSITPMIHPNGVFFLLPAAAYAVVALGIHKQQPSKASIVIFAVSAAIWLANAAYALVYWNGLLYDIAHRVGATAATHEGLAQLGHLGFGVAIIAAIALLAIWRGVSTGLLLVFALGAWFMSRVRVEQWYEPFASFAYLLMSLAILEILANFLATSRRLAIRGVRPTLITAMTLGLIIFHIRGGRIDHPRNYLGNLGSAGMHLGGNVPYFTPRDREILRNFIRSVEPGRRIVVEVHPWGDGLLIGDVDEPRALIQVPYLDAIHQPPQHWAWGYGPTEYPVPDLYLFHTSRYQPRYLVPRRDLVMEAALQRSGADAPEMLATRDTTETWYAIRATK